MDVRSPSAEPMQGRPATLVLGLVIAAVVLAAVAVVVVVAQVQVSAVMAERDVDATRTCGSVIDTVVDRTGWETWWARDLDEGDPAVRSALVRTTGCPDAINQRLAIGATLAALAAVMAVGALAATNRRARAATRSGVADRLVRLGRATSSVGAALTVAGLVALALLVADADSTLFLYTDRLVVGVVGLIVLVPTVALFVIGRALTILGAPDDSVGAERVDA
jgi:hypothetical protein